MPDNATVRRMKKTLIYGFGLIILLSGLGGITNGGLGILGGPICILTALLIMPITRGPVISTIKSAGGPDLSTFGRGAFVILIIAGLVTGAALIPAADSPSAEELDSPTSPSNSTNSADSTSNSSPATSSGDSSNSTSDSSPATSSGDSSDSTSDSSPATSSGDSSDSTSDSSTDDTSDSSTDGSTSDSPDDSTNSGPETSWTVTVISVTDGDTMDVRMPDGSTETIRLLGVDTPETSAGSTDPTEWENIPDNSDGQKWLANWGNKASAYAEERLAGEEIYIEVDSESDRRGSYGRLLVYASQSESSSKSFNRRLIENGYARMYDSQFRERSSYQSTEYTAQSNDVGVWDYTESTTSSSPTGGDSGSTVAVSNIHAEAAGNDHDNLNGEYIELTNEGSAAVDMTGWTLADAVDHTFYFPSGFTLGASESVTIYTGSGSNSAMELYWGSGSAIWNNSGDTIIVTNDSGEAVINREY